MSAHCRSTLERTVAARSVAFRLSCGVERGGEIACRPELASRAMPASDGGLEAISSPPAGG